MPLKLLWHAVFKVAVLCLAVHPLETLGVIAFADEPIPFNPNKLYGSEHVSKIEISMEPQLWDKLRLQKRDFADSMLDPSTSTFDNFHADIRIDGFEIPNVAIRKKGFFGSVDDNFPSLKIKLDEYVNQSPMGLSKRLTLNNNKQDLPLVSQYMAYRFFNQVGVPAPRVGFASLFVNGKHLGVYSVIETLDKPFLTANFGSSSGDLLEGTLADFSKKSLKRMDLKSGENKTYQNWRVNELAELLEGTELDMVQLKELIDLDRFYRYWATESLLAFWDGYNANQNNFFVYDDPKSGRMHFMPWGADSLWSTMSGPFGGFSKPNESVFANSLLSNRLFKTEEGRERYRQSLSELLAKHWDETAMKGKVDELAELIKPHLHTRQKNAAGAQREMKRFIDTRRQRVDRELQKWPVTIPDKARRPTYANEVGEASGEFATFWQTTPKDQQSSGKLTLRLGNEDVEFLAIKITAKRFTMGFMGFGAPSETQPPIVEFAGESTAGEKYVLSLTFDNSDFANPEMANANIGIRGSVTKIGTGPPAGPMGGPNMSWLKGTCELSESSTKPGSPVVGQFRGKLFRLIGGFFGG